MIDVSDYRVVRKENRGVHPNKVWLITPVIQQGKKRIALLKVTENREDGTSLLSHFGEMLYSDISNELLGFPCAKIDRVVYQGKDGILSYNVLDDIPGNNDDNTRYILQDMASIINSTEHDFDMETLKVRGQNEYYSVEMILKALKNASTSEEEYQKLEEFLINLCLIDSITNYNDRHSMNLSAGYDNFTGNIFPVAVYDNGGCFGLNVSETEVRRAVEKKSDAERIRKASTSKIGILSKTPISFDLLETLIFNHYYEVAKPLAKKIALTLLPERIDEILAREDYKDMPEVYKIFVKNQVEFNRLQMLNRIVKSRARNEIEQYIENGDKLDNYIDEYYKLNGRHLGGRAQALNHILLNALVAGDIKLEGPILSAEDFKILEEIEKSPETFCDGRIICLDHDRNIAKWTVIYNKILNSMDKSIPEKVRKEKLNELFIKKMNFYPPDIEEINILSDVYNIEQTYQDRNFVRTFVTGRKGIGDDKVDSFLILQRAKAIENKDDLSNVEEFEKLYVDILEKEEAIREYLGKDDSRFSFIRSAGILNEDEIYRLVYFSLDKIKEKNKHFASKEAFEKYIIEQAKYFEKDKYDVVDGRIVTKKDLSIIKNNIYTLPNGEEAVIIEGEISGFNNIVFGMGINHAIQIKKVDDNGNFNISFAHSKNVCFPSNVKKQLDLLEEKERDSSGLTLSRRAIKKFKSKNEESKLDELFSYTGNIKKTSEQIKNHIVSLYEAKIKKKSKVPSER